MIRKTLTIPVTLTSILTQDHVPLAGAFVEPRGRKNVAIIWLHGLTSSFATGQPLMKELSDACQHAGIGYFKFNTRGHDIAVRGGRKLVGTGFENFSDCLKDIDAMVRFVRSRGYQRVVLAGHSTGANKALYYAAKRHARILSGIILAGPISDVAGLRHDVGQKELDRRIALAKRLFAKNKQALMPLPGFHGTAARYLSLYEPGHAEDTFPYYNPRARWTALRSVRQPIAVIIGSKDGHLDRPVPEFLQAFAVHAMRAKSFSSLAIKGADHGFHGKEKALAATIMAWIQESISVQL